MISLAQLNDKVKRELGTNYYMKRTAGNSWIIARRNEAVAEIEGRFMENGTPDFFVNVPYARINRSNGNTTKRATLEEAVGFSIEQLRKPKS